MCFPRFRAIWKKWHVHNIYKVCVIGIPVLLISFRYYEVSCIDMRQNSSTSLQQTSNKSIVPWYCFKYKIAIPSFSVCVDLLCKWWVEVMLIGVLMSQPVNSRCSVFFSNIIFMIAQTTRPVVVRQYVISGRKHYHYIYGKGEYWNTNNYHHYIPRYWDICKYIDIKELQIMKIGVFRNVLNCLPKYMLLLAVVNCCLDGPRCRCMKNGGPGPLGPWNIDPMHVI